MAFQDTEMLSLSMVLQTCPNCKFFTTILTPIEAILLTESIVYLNS